MKAHVIAFRQDLARREKVRRRVKALGLDLAFVDAVRGSELDESAKSPFTGSARQLWSSHRHQDNAMGCSLSHFEAWRLIAEGGEGCGVVMEDDAMAVPGMEGEVAGALGKLERNLDRHDVVFLTRQRPNIGYVRLADLDARFHFAQAVHNDFGAVAYFITADACRYFMRHPARHVFEVDFLLHHWWRHTAQSIHLLPSLFQEDGRESSIGYRAARDWPRDTAVHRLARRWNRVRDSMSKRGRFKGHVRRMADRLTAKRPGEE